MAADPCIKDTDCIALSIDPITGELCADPILDDDGCLECTPAGLGIEIDPDPDNGLECRPTGLFSDPVPDIATPISNIACAPSADNPNALRLVGDELYVPEHHSFCVGSDVADPPVTIPAIVPTGVYVQITPNHTTSFTNTTCRPLTQLLLEEGQSLDVSFAGQPMYFALRGRINGGVFNEINWFGTNDVERAQGDTGTLARCLPGQLVPGATLTVDIHFAIFNRGGPAPFAGFVHQTNTNNYISLNSKAE